MTYSTGCTSIYKIVKGKAPDVEVVNTKVAYNKSFPSEEMSVVMQNLKVLSYDDTMRIPGSGNSKHASKFITDSLSAVGYETKDEEFTNNFKVKSELSLTSEDGKTFYNSVLTHNSSNQFMNGTYEVVDLGTGKVVENKKYDIKNKIVLIRIGYADIAKTMKIYEDQGAVAVIGFSQTREDFVHGSLKDPSKIPLISVSKADGNSLGLKAEELGKKFKLKITNNEIEGSGKTKNIWVETNPNATNNIILTTNFDSSSLDTTNDNATGVATLLKIAEYFKTNTPSNLNVVMAFLGGSSSDKSVLEDFINKHQMDYKNGNLRVINIGPCGIGDTLNMSVGNQNDDFTKYIKDLSQGMGYKIVDGEDELKVSSMKYINLSLEGADRKKDVSDNFSKINQQNLYQMADIIINSIKQIK